MEETLLSNLYHDLVEKYEEQKRILKSVQYENKWLRLFTYNLKEDSEYIYLCNYTIDRCRVILEKINVKEQLHMNKIRKVFNEIKIKVDNKNLIINQIDI